MNTRPNSRRGFTLIELMVAVSVVGILSTIAFPSIEGQLQRMRRVDALVAMMGVQLAQERWRSNAAAYATLAEIGISEVSPGKFYALRTSSAGRDGYVLDATAIGAQQRDRQCRNLRMSVSGADIAYASGPDASVANTEAANRRCWNR